VVAERVSQASPGCTVGIVQIGRPRSVRKTLDLLSFDVVVLVARDQRTYDTIVEEIKSFSLGHLEGDGIYEI
jgi:hypothetical protein